MIITYEQVFGVPLGNEVQESHGVTYRPCPAVTSLRTQLLSTTVFSQHPRNVAGMGPLFRDGFRHEFNRHHAGLAVDIMLQPGTTEVALGHHLVMLFIRFASLMQWRGMIYQNVTIDLNVGSRTASRWTKGGHEDHVHIDWHNSSNATWRAITQVPLRRLDGNVVTMTPVDPGRIAETITWTNEAMTNFQADPDLRQALQDLVDQHSRGELSRLDMDTQLSVSGTPAALAITNQLQGTWNVSIGPWSGHFVFGAANNVYWTDNSGSARHQGRWWLAPGTLQWRFHDAGDIRTFSVQLPLNGTSQQGRILPTGQGYFAMNKAA